jgi:NADH-quinone oxidoreductase subunit E
MTPEEKDKIKNTVAKTLSRYKNDKGMLVSILQDVQKDLYYLSEDALKEVSSGLGVPVSRVYSVATFFKAFTLKPRGRHLINVCLGTACHVRGAIKVLDGIERKLGIQPGGTTEDFKYTLETVNCLGACALGPIVVIDGKYHGEMSSSKVDALLESYA